MRALFGRDPHPNPAWQGVIYPSPACPCSDVPVTDADTIGYPLRRHLNWDTGPSHPRAFLKALDEFLLLRRRYPAESWSRLVEAPEGPTLLRIQ